MKPQHQDQSKRVRWQNSNNWATVFSSSSKDRRFRSDQIVHIKQPRTKSQISELCFPIQWYQLNNNSTTEPGMTQSIPNNRSIDIHKEWVIGQKSNRWSTDSELQQHKQQRFTKGRPRSIRLSKVRIWPWVAVHMKEATLLRTLTFQIPFQGKVEGATCQMEFLLVNCFWLYPKNLLGY